MKNKLLYLKIFAILALAYSLSSVFVNEVFVAGTPQIRPNLKEYLAVRFYDIRRGNLEFIAQALDWRSPEQKLKNIPLMQTAKGVYAKSDKNVSYTLIKANEVEWVEYTFDVKGKQIKIKVPKGEKPPPKEMFENLE